ncbi:MAG: hypothetical protein BJ554DRAFT_8144 [Olpidium bornovanus]|uniref:Uncharacterized protein n=1 Tax=Olpidium bornovanus TaxID=278681 RepID=A0A8H7ZV68_9FUNG|nr:MAG: hypothetical protein BJ554DRAFT_8144 [Olpidium bornovanus]
MLLLYPAAVYWDVLSSLRVKSHRNPALKRHTPYWTSTLLAAHAVLSSNPVAEGAVGPSQSLRSCSRWGKGAPAVLPAAITLPAGTSTSPKRTRQCRPVGKRIRSQSASCRRLALAVAGGGPASLEIQDHIRTTEGAHGDGNGEDRRPPPRSRRAGASPRSSAWGRRGRSSALFMSTTPPSVSPRSRHSPGSPRTAASQGNPATEPAVTAAPLSSGESLLAAQQLRSSPFSSPTPGRASRPNLAQMTPVLRKDGDARSQQERTPSNAILEKGGGSRDDKEEEDDAGRRDSVSQPLVLQPLSKLSGGDLSSFALLVVLCGWIEFTAATALWCRPSKADAVGFLPSVFRRLRNPYLTGWRNPPPSSVVGLAQRQEKTCCRATQSCVVRSAVRVDFRHNTISSQILSELRGDRCLFPRKLPVQPQAVVVPHRGLGLREKVWPAEVMDHSDPADLGSAVLVDRREGRKLR